MIKAVHLKTLVLASMAILSACSPESESEATGLSSHQSALAHIIRNQLEREMEVDIPSVAKRAMKLVSTELPELRVDEEGWPIDCWGQRFQIAWGGSKNECWVQILSSGADKRFGTRDDWKHVKGDVPHDK